MSDPATSYFFKKYYRNIIKWWFVSYNPDYIKVWPSREEAEQAHQRELEEAELARQQELEAGAYNAATGSYSGLYGQAPVDEDTQSALDAIMAASSSQNSIDSLFEPEQDEPEREELVMSPEQEAIIAEANAIFERLQREAAEDEAKKQAEIDAAKQSASS